MSETYDWEDWISRHLLESFHDDGSDERNLMDECVA